VTKVIFLMNL